MARRPRLLAPSVSYHFIVRGNQWRKTFLDASDYQAYLERLGCLNGITLKPAQIRTYASKTTISPGLHDDQRLPPSVFRVLRHGLLLGNGARHLRKQYGTRPPLGHFRLKSPADHGIGVDQVRCRVNHGSGPVLLSDRADFCGQ